MIIVKLMGGLGNQMFQYAFGQGIGAHHKQRLFYDNNFFEINHYSSETFTARSYGLGIFPNIKVKFVPYSLRNVIHNKGLFISRLLNRLKILHHTFQIQNEQTKIKCYSNCINIFDGYFQNPGYFEKIKNQIYSEFEFPQLDAINQQLAEKIQQCNSVAVHFRRSDYFKIAEVNRILGILPTDYYQKGMSIMSERLNNLVFYLFTDDFEWLRCNVDLSSYNVIYVEGNSGNESWKDMCLISLAKHQIIANSTFSWWGAWLNKNPDKNVIAPVKWFADPDLNKYTDTLIPEAWIRI